MERVYLDNGATTRVDPRVAELCLNMMTEHYGNPSSLHQMGLEAQLAVEEAGRRILTARVEKASFCSPPAAPNPTIWRCWARRRRFAAGEPALSPPPMSTPRCWRRPPSWKKAGFSVNRVRPAPGGALDPERIAEACREDTVLVSVMLVNNELGHIAPLERIVPLVRQKSPLALIHCDAVQAFGKIPFRADHLDLDLVSVSGHKIHAPKGVGALYIKKGARILPRLFGGGQQKELRPGTENVPLICGFGLAALLATRELDGHYDAVSRLNGRMREGLRAVEGAVINSPDQGASPYILNFSLPGYRSETLLHMLESRDVYVSSGSACSKGKPSHALTEAGLPPALVDSAVRVSFSRYSTKGDVDALLLALSEGLPTLRRTKH